MVIVATYLTLRWAAGRAADRLARHRHTESWIGRTILSLATLALEAMALAAAWALGTFVAVRWGPTGMNALNQQLFINAFVMAEAIKLAARAVLRPRRSRLRLVPMITATAAAYWYFWIARTTSIIVYAFLFVAPIAAWNVSFGAGQAIRVLAVLTACLVGILVTLQNRDVVRGVMMRRAVNGQNDATARFMAVLARVWHIFAILYFVALFLIWMTRPDGALGYMLGSTVESLIALAVGVVVASFLSRVISGGMRLSPNVKQRTAAARGGGSNAFVCRKVAALNPARRARPACSVAVAQAWEAVRPFHRLGSPAYGFRRSTDPR